MLPPHSLQKAIEKTVRDEWGRILAALVTTLGDFQLAEDSLQDAIISAMQHWQINGLPRSPAAWLITTARRKAIDRLRRDQNFNSKQADISYLLDLEHQAEDAGVPELIADKRLEMIFTCCHPALEEKTRVALTLRTLGGLTTEEIAAAFLDRPDAMAQRLVRAKKKIALAGIPYQVPDHLVLPERLSSVLGVLYLIFNAGYSGGSGETPVRSDLTEEAIRLTRIICELLPDEPEVDGLLALMLLHDSRRFSRSDANGNLVPLELQNRKRWDASKIGEGAALLEDILPKQRVGPYQVQAAISALHAQSASWDATDWPQIEALYQMLYRMQPTPVVYINLAVAVSYAHSTDVALRMLDSVADDGRLNRYQPFFAAKADVLSRAGNPRAAKACFQTAIDLATNSFERQFLHQKILSLDEAE
ncbi:MAG: RNA polymerase sigma factor [Hyphomicrobiales bacterium]